MHPLQFALPGGPELLIILLTFLLLGLPILLVVLLLVVRNSGDTDSTPDRASDRIADIEQRVEDLESKVNNDDS